MKRHIAPEDLNQLSEKARERLREWWKPRAGDLCWSHIGDTIKWGVNFSGSEMIVLFDKNESHYKDNLCLPLLSIGQMIQFLSENAKDGEVFMEIVVGWKQDDLCDLLFEDVKSILEEDAKSNT